MALTITHVMVDVINDDGDTVQEQRPIRLDRTMPYSRVFSARGGVKFEQSGLLFHANGKQVGVEDDFPVDGNTLPDNSQSIKLRNDDENEEQAIEYEDMNWQELRALVESFGETYRNKGQAIQFLRGNV